MIFTRLILLFALWQSVAYAQSSYEKVGQFSVRVGTSVATHLISPNQFLNVRPDGTFVVIWIDVWNQGKLPVRPPEFGLKDRSGNLYSPSDHGWVAFNAFNKNLINPGNSRGGNIVFDVPYWQQFFDLVVSDGSNRMTLWVGTPSQTGNLWTP